LLCLDLREQGPSFHESPSSSLEENSTGTLFTCNTLPSSVDVWTRRVGEGTIHSKKKQERKQDLPLCCIDPLYTLPSPFFCPPARAVSGLRSRCVHFFSKCLWWRSLPLFTTAEAFGLRPFSWSSSALIQRAFPFLSYTFFSMLRSSPRKPYGRPFHPFPRGESPSLGGTSPFLELSMIPG